MRFPAANLPVRSARLPVEKVDVLSSPADDKCPFVYNNTMGFTSNRPGGKGGFDPYTVGLEGSPY